jgi:ribosomal protein L11 methyltransferase
VIRLALRVRREDAELALAELLALAPSGVEEVALGDGLVEYAVYGARGELPELPQLHAAAGAALVQVSTTELADDWSERWKRFHRPILIAGRGAGAPALHVRPPWEAPSDRAGALEIEIDPGQAFGTGAHATTSLCLELLLELAGERGGRGAQGGGRGSDGEPEGCGEREERGAHGGRGGRGAVLDVGCGSGVLGIAAARLGFAPVLGLDHEAESVRASAENARVNGVAVRSRRFDLRRERLPALAGGPAPIVLANLVRGLLLDLARALPAQSYAPEHVIASGLLCEEADEVVRAFGEQAGLRERERRKRGEWAAVWLTAGPA